MDLDALPREGIQPIDVRRATVKGMTLRIGDRATLVPDPDGCVHGMAMCLSHSELDRLYATPNVSAYRPEPVIANLEDGSALPALCFNLPIPPEPRQTNPEYLITLRIVARRLGLPEDYIEHIR
jgi:hypothetical protein